MSSKKLTAAERRDRRAAYPWRRNPSVLTREQSGEMADLREMERTLEG